MKGLQYLKTEIFYCIHYFFKKEGSLGGVRGGGEEGEKLKIPHPYIWTKKVEH